MGRRWPRFVKGVRAMFGLALLSTSTLDDKDSTATALLNLGEIVEAEGNTHEAHEHYRDSLKLYGDLGHKLAIAYCAEVIAGLEVRANSHSSEAAFLFGAAEAIREEIEAPVESFNTERIEDDKRRTREAMDEDDSLAAWEAGRQLGIDGVLRHVLGQSWYSGKEQKDAGSNIF